MLTHSTLGVDGQHSFASGRKNEGAIGQPGGRGFGPFQLDGVLSGRFSRGRVDTHNFDEVIGATVRVRDFCARGRDCHTGASPIGVLRNKDVGGSADEVEPHEAIFGSDVGDLGGSIDGDLPVGRE